MTIVTSAQFDLIYIPVLILCAGLFIYSGLKQKYPASTLASLTVFLMALFVIGLKIISYPLFEWPKVLTQSPVEILHSKYLPGGIIFVALGLIILKFVLKVRLSILDSLILGLPIIGILQRIDCMLSGCCYGIPTQLPWAIHYINIAPSYKQHASEGLINETAISSLGVHPTQLYYIIGFLLVFGALIIFRNKVKSPGSLAFLGFILMAVSRFIIEFFREPVQNRLSTIQWAGVNLLQWITLAIILVLALVLYKREKHYNPLKTIALQSGEYLLRSSFILFVSAALVWNFSRILAYSEFFLLQTLIVLSILVVGIRLYQKSTIPLARYPILATLLLAVIIMSQKSTDTIISSDSLFHPKNWWDIKASAGGGKYDQINYDCSGNETSRTPQQYSIFSGGFAYNSMKSSNRHLQAGLNLGRFYDSGDALSTMINTTESINNMSVFVINPYFKFDFQKVGFGFGYNFLLQEGNPGLPSLYFRAFRRDKFFFDANLADNFYSSGLAGVWQVGVGTGFGAPEKHLLRFGISTVYSKAIGYVEGRFLLNDRLYIQSSLGFGNKIHGMFGLQYQVGKNR